MNAEYFAGQKEQNHKRFATLRKSEVRYLLPEGYLAFIQERAMASLAIIRTVVQQLPTENARHD